MFTRCIKTSILLLALLLGAASLAHAERLLMGKVISVDREHGTVTLMLDATGNYSSGSDSKQERVTVRIDKDRISRGVRQGRMVRVWIQDGQTAEGKAFTASRITPRCCFDRTGVRRRLGRAGGRGGAMIHGGGRGGRH